MTILFDRNKLKVGFPKLGSAIDIYISRIEGNYYTDSNPENLRNLIAFLKVLPKLSKEQLEAHLPKLNSIGCKRIYHLYHGNKNAVQDLLDRSGWRVEESKMDEYVQYMQNTTKKKLAENIERLEQLLHANNTNTHTV